MNFSMLAPELMATAVLVFMLVREIFKKDQSIEDNTGTWFAAIAGVFLTLAALFPLYGKNAAGFHGTLILDSFALFFKTIFSLIMLVLIFMSREFFKTRQVNISEFLMILWSSLIGLFFLASANDFIVLFVSLEIFTLSIYVLAAYLKKEMISIEAGLKYLIMGSLASAFTIYGIALIFTATGSTSLLALKEVFRGGVLNNPLPLLGILFVVAGLGFKIASVPFQLWAPDVYQGAPTPVSAYLASASKSAGFMVLLRLLATAFPTVLTEEKRMLLFTVLAALTLLYGNLGALLQTNIKRLLGYSSISHAGYLMIGLAAGRSSGTAAILYYLIAYAISTLAVFQIVTIMEKSGGNDLLESYRGLGKRSPFLAGVLFLALLSLAGVPPLAGFFGKFLIFLAAVRNGAMGLAFLGAVLVAVSLYYYLNLVRIMYFDKNLDETTVTVPNSSKTVLIILSAGIIIAGLWQAPFFNAALAAAKSLF